MREGVFGGCSSQPNAGVNVGSLQWLGAPSVPAQSEDPLLGVHPGGPNSPRVLLVLAGNCVL